MNTIRIQIPSLSENVRMIESFIDNAREKFEMQDDIYGNIMIAVTESVNNAITHGNGKDKGKNVNITLQLEEGLVRFTVEDEGEGFDYNNLPDPTSPENLSKPGGRGIFLMKQLSDEVNFKQGGKVVELCFYVN